MAASAAKNMPNCMARAAHTLLFSLMLLTSLRNKGFKKILSLMRQNKAAFMVNYTLVILKLCSL